MRPDTSIAVPQKVRLTAKDSRTYTRGGGVVGNVERSRTGTLGAAGRSLLMSGTSRWTGGSKGPFQARRANRWVAALSQATIAQPGVFDDSAPPLECIGQIAPGMA